MKAITWVSTKVVLLDQTLLPTQEVYLDITDYEELALAIENMLIRGAPAIGAAAAYGVALGANQIAATSKEAFLEKLKVVSDRLAGTRPTAVNLFWALERMDMVARLGDSVDEIKKALVVEACRIDADGEAANRRMGNYGADLIKDGYTVLTHCNAGALATEGYGTALGVIRAAVEQGKNVRVYADETRPLLQGARLTAWELVKDGIDVTLITDNMAGHFLKSGAIDCVVVGADRIAANGDVANKIGTYGVAVLAKENNVPFYVAAPISTVDMSLASGEQIPIEERKPEEVTHIKGVQIAPDGVKVANPAFDVTPNKYVTAIITENGIASNPYVENLDRVVKNR
ncbi:MAG: S-methyl-5-thioribose-1-phosphate isomerase [Chloroflexi bacterium]|nr:S-methyl-5-thioribose-1-phosphate isomerase [Chloroflexota bacterium]MBT7080843.1 S-methyl-5-thioribose-1-phosphate isomerase [Chloroflexota bacterium]MBT7290173.1 S-methyl-5-thioribose-1-phosphate isomerase [Chloroflexota bacterium]